MARAGALAIVSLQGKDTAGDDAVDREQSFGEATQSLQGEKSPQRPHGRLGLTKPFQVIVQTHRPAHHAVAMQFEPDAMMAVSDYDILNAIVGLQHTCRMRHFHQIESVVVIGGRMLALGH